MGEGKERIDTIKDVIKRLHASGGSNREALEREFADKIRNASALEISQAEQEAIDGGVSVDSIRSLCAVHLEMFAKEKQDETIDVEPWHPLHILMEEHTDMANRVRGLTAYVHAILHDGDRERGAAGLRAAAGYLDEMELYFQKEENALFPVLERHDIVQPPAVMWSEHDELRALRKRFRAEVDGPCEGTRVRDIVLAMVELLTHHIFKEHSVLFPSALSVVTAEEWRRMRDDFDEIGYFAYKPIPMMPAAEEADGDEGTGSGQAGASQRSLGAGGIFLGSGYLSNLQLDRMLRSLPVDVTFVDTEDRVRFFSETADRIFVRNRGIIGRKVQNCHPPKSVHVVNRILEDFRAGRKDEEAFYLHLGERYVYIRYIAVRDADRSYLGCLEVTQDIAPIQKITGEKRIMDGEEK